MEPTVAGLYEDLHRNRLTKEVLQTAAGLLPLWEMLFEHHRNQTVGTIHEHSIRPGVWSTLHRRDFAVNLIPLGELGTIEYRGHASTLNTRLITKWVRHIVLLTQHAFNNSTLEIEP